MKRQFFEVYDPKIGQTLPVLRVLDSEERFLLSEYQRDTFYCPVCHEAPLTFVTGSTNSHEKSFFRTKVGAHHSPGCVYSVEEARGSELTEYYHQLSDIQMQDKLGTMLRYLSRQANKFPDKDAQNKEILTRHLTFRAGQSHKNKRVITRALSEYYRTEPKDYHIPILFYGEALLCNPKNENAFLYSHSVKIIFPCYRGKLAKKHNIIYLNGINCDFSNYHIGQPCHLAMVVILSKKENSALHADLYNRNALRFEQ